MNNLAEYASLFIFIGLGCLVFGFAFLFSGIFREKRSDLERKSIYECGMKTIGTSYVSPNIRFYIFALLFVVFDVEAIFLLPWAVQVRELGWVAFGVMGIFILILMVPLAAVWRWGALKWE